jgi:hypothetical protein
MNYAAMNYAATCEKIVVLGFYDRNNTGDECFKIAFRKVLQVECIFICMDDVTQEDIQRHNPSCVVIGGGDIINPYFMEQAKKVLHGYTGPVYGLSIGCPYESCAHYLDIFDHVFTRSTRDTGIAVERIGSENVTHISDLSTCLRQTSQSQKYIKTAQGILRIGVCLAQPVFYNNPHAHTLMRDIIATCRGVYKHVHDMMIAKGSLLKIEWHLIPFNYSLTNKAESDWEAMNLFMSLCGKRISPEGSEDDVIIIDPITLYTPSGTGSDISISQSISQSVYDYINQELDFMICMRYHSVMFSLVSGTPFVALYTSTKIQGCLDDIKGVSQYGEVLQLDKTTQKPCTFSLNSLTKKCTDVLDSFSVEFQKSMDKMVFYENELVRHIQLIQDHIVKCMKRKRAFVYRSNISSSFNAVIQQCVWGLSEYLHIDQDTVYNLIHTTNVSWNDIITQQMHGPDGPGGPDCQIESLEKKAENIARLICFSASKQLQDPCMWGMREALLSRPLLLRDSIAYIWQHGKDACVPCKISLVEPTTQKMHQTWYKSISIDPHISLSLNSLSSVHRSGWSWALSGLLSLDAMIYGGSEEAPVIFDSFVDRTFHWCCDILSTFHTIPYIKPWFGCVHHTFDTTHSEYNCSKLFENPVFIESLKTCKGLISLSVHLAGLLRERLKEIAPLVPVHVVYHPMFTPELTFTMSRYEMNPNRRIVQIGAWLRRPYTIFTLDTSIIQYSIQKSVLQGVSMDLNFPPRGYEEFIENLPFVYTTTTRRKSRDVVEEHIGDPSDTHDIECRDIVCRDNINSSNKFLQGVSDVLQHHYYSVDIIENLTNEEYDVLLSQNIVFLHLVDCSAVNTVLECIVRNTPIIVNRLPALEEVLGAEYPGFYSDPLYALSLCDTMSKVQAIHEYLTRLDKTRYRLEHFVARIHSIISASPGSSQEPNYPLFTAQPDTAVNQYEPLLQPLNTFARFLPPSFQQRRWR